MKVTIFLAFLSISLRAFFSGEIDQVKEQLLDRAISDRDFKEFKRLLGSSTSSKTKGKLSGKFGSYLLSLSINSSNRKRERYVCRPQFVEFLIKKGVKPLEKDVVGIIRNICPRSLKLVAPKSPSLIIARASKNLNLIDYSDVSNDQTLAPRLVSVIQFLAGENKRHCLGRNPNCEALAHLRREVKALEVREKALSDKQRFYKTQKGRVKLIVEKACFYNSEYQKYLRKIEEERERGKISGYVNASFLKEWGDKAFNEKRERDKTLKRASLEFSDDLCNRR